MKFQMPKVVPNEPTRPRDPAASMKLINDVVRHPLDPSYEAVAAKRRAAGLPSSSGTRSPLLILATFLIDLGVAVSAMALRVPLGVAKKNHDELVSRIDSGQKAIDTRSKTLSGLNSEIAKLQESALARGNRTDTTKALREAEVVTGAVAVKGPGLVLTVSDARGSGTNGQGDPRTSASSAGRLTSSDLQVIANGLWQAGAEAMSINGQRITSTTAIRFAGEAILVNYRPLVPPYAISVIGPKTMQADFGANAGGNYLAQLVKGFGIGSSFVTNKSVSLPAAPSVALNYAHPQKETK